MAYNFTKLEEKIRDTEKWLENEFSTIRTGRATPAILDSVMVDSYGSKVPIKQIGNINVEDAKTLRVTPWDAGQIRDIEKAISSAELGLSVAVDEKGVRAIFPELTSERRESLIKVSKEKLEKAKISLRQERDEIWNDIQKKQKDGELSEDEKFKLKDEMQKLIDEKVKGMTEMTDRKEKEIKE
jgi:ribosome recycling factor